MFHYLYIFYNNKVILLRNHRSRNLWPSLQAKYAKVVQ